MISGLQHHAVFLKFPFPVRIFISLRFPDYRLFQGKIPKTENTARTMILVFHHHRYP